MQSAQNSSKDILIVVHNQLDFLKQCIQSVEQHTSNYHLFIWDNDSNQETQNYIQSLDCTWIRCQENLGFGLPNDFLAAMGSSDYLILLNSDTQVFAGWSEAMLGFLQAHPGCAQVGYMGGLLDETGRGGRIAWGHDIDYIMGFCTCMRRSDYEIYGLFDPQFRFAYCEDADLSLRIKQKSSIYALHLLLVHHYENKTIKSVHQEGSIDIQATFEQNHSLLRERWADYLENRKMASARLEVR
jgi:GT2 family glycosyltransferase